MAQLGHTGLNGAPGGVKSCLPQTGALGDTSLHLSSTWTAFTRLRPRTFLRERDTDLSDRTQRGSHRQPAPAGWGDAVLRTRCHISLSSSVWATFSRTNRFARQMTGRDAQDDQAFKGTQAAPHTHSHAALLSHSLALGLGAALLSAIRQTPQPLQVSVCVCACTRRNKRRLASLCRPTLGS